VETIAESKAVSDAKTQTPENGKYIAWITGSYDGEKSPSRSFI
jgi:hypothetical protein